MNKQVKHSLLWLMLLLCFSACKAKYVFTYQSEGVKSEFKFYDNNRYCYIEELGGIQTKVKGHYTTKDSIFLLEFPKENGFPISYKYKGNPSFIPSRNRDTILIELVDMITKESILFANIGGYDSSGELQFGKETNLDGIAKIKRNLNVVEFIVSFIGCEEARISVSEEMKINDLKMEMLCNISGGRTKQNGCFIDFIDNVLEFKLINRKFKNSIFESPIVYSQKTK